MPLRASRGGPCDPEGGIEFTDDGGRRPGAEGASGDADATMMVDTGSGGE